MAELQAQLYDDDLGFLDLGCDPYVVTSVQIGSPAVREVTRVRSLADGTFDESRFIGARGITLALRLRNHSACDPGGSKSMQDLIDTILPYMSPRRRPLLIWKLPGSDQTRGAYVRGSSWPVAVEGPKFPVLPLQWVVPDGELVDLSGGIDPLCVDISPSTDTEAGRTYDLHFDRSYPAGQPIGGRLVTNPGNLTTHWELTIFGGCTNPFFQINDHTMEFDRNGGLVLLGGQSVVIDSRARTILFNGEPGQSRYDRVNYMEWTWDDLLLRPGQNIVRYGAAVLSLQSAGRLCYRPAYL
jgi:hypothetical protein